VQLLPDPHDPQLPLLPEQLVVVIDMDTCPALQVHAVGCALPPMHTLPAPQLVVRQLPLLPAQLVVVVDVDA
jgi:hypothetical protein